eukprot:SAG31_NODE_41629_length_275_cov_0.590909_1_plen_23_part_01
MHAVSVVNVTAAMLHSHGGHSNS